MSVYGLPPSGGIVVGVVDGPSAHGAVVWAARAAQRRRLPLIVCHAYRAGDARTDHELDGAARNRALRTARYGVEIAEAEAPGVWAVPWVGRGSASQVLIDAIKQPAMIVVGCRSRGRLAAALLATFCGWAGSLEPCPVIAVPGRLGAHRRLSLGRGRRGERRRGRGQVVVASTADEGNESVAQFAVTEATLWGTRVVEVAAPGFDLSARNPGEALSMVAKEADLLVVGKPIDGAPERLRTPASGPGETLETPPAATLGAALGYGAFRRLATPVAVVPVVRALPDMSVESEPIMRRRQAPRSRQLAAVGAARVPGVPVVGADAPAAPAPAATGVAAARNWRGRQYGGTGLA